MSYVEFTIGGVTYSVPPLTLYALEKCWGSIQAVSTTTDAVVQAGYILNTLAAGIELTDPTVTVDSLKKKMTLHDFGGLSTSFAALLRESGLSQKEDPGTGEAQAASQDQTGTAS